MNEPIISLEFKSATIYAIRAVVRSNDLTDVLTQLNQRMREAGSLFQGESIVIDASELDEPLDWDKLMAAFRSYNLPVIGLVANDTIAQSARQAGLNRVELSGTPARSTTATQSAASVAQTVADPTPVPAVNVSKAERMTPTTDSQHAAAPQPTLVVEGPLRSGQRVYARHTDLIVMGVVSQGAEVIADGNIHVYGPLRGKAMAGARGDTQARIFTTSLDAELVAIAGVYRVIDGPLGSELQRRPAMIDLVGQALRIEALKA